MSETKTDDAPVMKSKNPIKSTTVWGVIVMIMGVVAGYMNWDWWQAMQGHLGGFFQLIWETIGAAIALWGRWKAETKLKL